MRRLLLALTVLSLIVPATAQMRGGGMRAGGFGARGFNGGRRAGSPVVRPAGPRALGGFGFLGVNRRAAHRGFNRFGNRGFFRNGFNCGFGNGFSVGVGFNNGFCNGFNNGFGFGGWGLPWYAGDWDSDFTGAAYAEHTLRYNDDDGRSRDVQMGELLDQIRDQQRELDYLVNNMQRGPEGQQQQSPMASQGNQRPQSRPYNANAAPATQSSQPTTTLVFKDGHRMDVQNYVIAKSTLTVLDGGRRQHIALSQLDVPATQKVNEDKGVTFKAPTVNVSLLCNPAGPDFACHPHIAGRAETGAANQLRP